MPPPETPHHLPVRLKRESDLNSQLGCTAALSVLLITVATFACWAGTSPGKNQWAAWAVGGAFGFFGLLCLISYLRQRLASGIPVTIVELSVEPLKPGHTAKLCLIQRGPAKLKSLSAQLLCLQRTTVPIPNAPAGRPSTRLEQRTLHQETLINATHLRVAPGNLWMETLEFTLPSDAPVTSIQGNVEVLWKIEVWGTGHGLATFMHPFVVKVLAE
jgi:hypothetical protein